MGMRGDTLLVVCNFTPVPRHNYLVGVPSGGHWRELLNSDAGIYGGSGQGNLGGVEAAPVPAHGHYQSLSITLPPLACVVFEPEARVMTYDRVKPATQSPASTAGVDGRTRAVIESVQPQVDAGRFAIKRAVGDAVQVEADAFTDGHDAVDACCSTAMSTSRSRTEVDRCSRSVNDRWTASFTVTTIGRYRYTVVAWTDRFLTWRREFERRVEPADVLVRIEGRCRAAARRRRTRRRPRPIRCFATLRRASMRERRRLGRAAGAGR